MPWPRARAAAAEPLVTPRRPAHLHPYRIMIRQRLSSRRRASALAAVRSALCYEPAGQKFAEATKNKKKWARAQGRSAGRPARCCRAGWPRLKRETHPNGWAAARPNDEWASGRPIIGNLTAASNAAGTCRLAQPPIKGCVWVGSPPAHNHWPGRPCSLQGRPFP